MSRHTQSNLFKLAFAVVAVITASVCSYMEGALNGKAQMEHFEEVVQQDVMDEDR